MSIFTSHLACMQTSPVVDVIIPAYNEERSIGRVIADIPKDRVRHILVCNNRSTDKTSLIAKEAGAIVVDQPLRGYGHACLAGLEYIQFNHKNDPPDVVVFLDGDYADDPREMATLIGAIQAGFDLVIGSRTLGVHQQGALTFPQRFGNWLATRLIEVFYGFQFTDLGPFRAIRWDKLLLLDMRDTTFGWTVEMQIKALKHDLRCTEVPVSYRNRIGNSKISGTLRGAFMAGYKIIWTILKWR